MSAPVLLLDNNMKQTLDAGFAASFEGTPERYFSAPGRTEIGGNHTDHQRGRVLAGAVNLDTVAAKNEVLPLMSSRPPNHRAGRNNICINSGRKRSI